MKIETSLDVDVVALETDDEVSLLLELTAPTLTADEARAPATLVVVLDRSGSMSGARLAVAREALCDLVDRLDPTDSFGLVVFDDQADLVVPAGPLTDKDRTKQLVRSVRAGSATDLAAGYLRGLQEAARVGGAASKVLIVSDGHANAGITDPDRLGGVAAKARTNGVTTTTLGLGLGYDEALLGAVARSGGGSELFAEEPDSAAALIGSEVDGLLEQSVTAASLLVRPSRDVVGVRVVNDLPSNAVEGGVLVELGGLLSGESRKLVLTFTVPAMAALGPAEVVMLELRYVVLPGLVQESVSVPVRVNVVSGEEATGREPNPVVRTELLFQQVQGAKREASQMLRDGDVAGAESMLRSSLGAVGRAAAAASPAHAAELREEEGLLVGMVDEVAHGSASRASKTMRADSHTKSRTRGRASRTDGTADRGGN